VTLAQACQRGRAKRRLAAVCWTLREAPIGRPDMVYVCSLDGEAWLDAWQKLMLMTASAKGSA
jgi:hypothetical protein